MTPRLAPLLVLLAGCGPATPPAPQVRVAAAADLRFAFEDLSKEFRAREPGTELTSTFGASGTLYSQIANGGPFDVFLSADVGYAEKLHGAGLTVGPPVPYAVGHLVVWVPTGSPLDEHVGLNLLTDPRVKKAALANPSTAPYGRAAEAALRNLGLYDAVRGKLVFAENVAQAAQFAASGAADVGLIAKSVAVSPGLRDRGRYAEVPAALYPRLLQAGVVLKAAADPAAAQRFADFLVGTAGQEILARHGFARPGD